MSPHILKSLCSFALLLLCSGTVHAQQPGVDCAPIQGQGWSGCAPMNTTQGQQQPRAPLSPPEQWQDHWGAIATDAIHGSLGTAADMPSQSTAESKALADCQSKGGTKCKIDTRYRNACAAMVAGDTGYNVGSAATLSEAVQIGMKTCTDAGTAHCHVYYSACSLPVRIQ